MAMWIRVSNATMELSSREMGAVRTVRFRADISVILLTIRREQKLQPTAHSQTVLTLQLSLNRKWSILIRWKSFFQSNTSTNCFGIISMIFQHFSDFQLFHTGI